jgi:hypothetical protein
MCILFRRTLDQNSKVEDCPRLVISLVRKILSFSVTLYLVWLLGEHSLFCGARAVTVLGYPFAARRRSVIRHWPVTMCVHYGVTGSTTISVNLV